MPLSAKPAGYPRSLQSGLVEFRAEMTEPCSKQVNVAHFGQDAACDPASQICVDAVPGLKTGQATSLHEIIAVRNASTPIVGLGY